VIKRIERIRAATRNLDVLWLCDELERYVLARQLIEDAGSPEAAEALVEAIPDERAAELAAQGKRDRRAYQRELMRKRRAEGKI